MKPFTSFARRFTSFARRFTGFALALAAAATLSVSAQALINGVAPAGAGRASISRDLLGADHSALRFGFRYITDEMRQGSPTYYGVKNSKPAEAPGEPMPADAEALTPAQLAKKYRITILDKPGYLTGPYGEQAVALLDAGLEIYTAEFIHTLVDKLSEKGYFLCISLHYPNSTDTFTGATERDSNTLCINLCVPVGENYGGISVDTICHEMAHVIYCYLEQSMGEENLAHRWMALNGPYSYGSRDSGRTRAFISGYGSMYYYEDPATIAGAFAAAPEIVAERLATKDYGLLKKKAEFLEQCIEKYIGTPGTLFSDVWDIIAQKE